MGLLATASAAGLSMFVSFSSTTALPSVSGGCISGSAEFELTTIEASVLAVTGSFARFLEHHLHGLHTKQGT
jgi:hypothetical protein